MSYLAFENEQLPDFLGYDSENIITADEWINRNNPRYGKGLNFDKIQYSEEDSTFYYEEDNYFAILACMDIDAEEIEIKNESGNKPVKIIMTKAYSELPHLKRVKVGKKVERIQKYAFDDLNLSEVFIPETVLVIGKYGFNDCCQKFYFSASSVPDDWDSLWSGKTSPNIIFNSLEEDFSKD